MPCHLVAYDLNKETTRPKIEKEVYKTAYARLSESSYAIVSDEDPDDVFARFKPYLDSDDYLYVITLKRPISGFGSAEVIDWLEANVPW